VTGPRLFGELGAGITTRKVVIPAESPTDNEADHGAVESKAEEGGVASPPVLTGRRKGGPFRRVVGAEPQTGAEGWC
jgi:hypothetical protein